MRYPPASLYECNFSSSDLNALQVTLIGCCVLLTVVGLTYVFARCKPVYLLDYHCYKPPDRQVLCLCDTFCSQAMESITRPCSDALSAAALHDKSAL